MTRLAQWYRAPADTRGYEEDSSNEVKADERISSHGESQTTIQHAGKGFIVDDSGYATSDSEGKFEVNAKERGSTEVKDGQASAAERANKKIVITAIPMGNVPPWPVLDQVISAPARWRNTQYRPPTKLSSLTIPGGPQDKAAFFDCFCEVSLDVCP